MKYIFLLIFSLVCTLLPAQTMNFLFKGTITNHFTVKPEAKAEVAIVQNGKKIATVQTDNAGLYTLRGGVSITSNFYVVFSKTGMVEKRIEFDFTKLNEEDVPAGSEYQPVKDLSSSLINEDPKYNVSFLKTEPVGKLTWNDKKMAVEVNEGVRENMRKKIETALKDAGPKQTDAAKYQSLIVAAQSFEKEQKYQQAITKYEEALSLRPTEKLPSDKIVELSALLAKSQKESAILDQGNQQYMNLIVAAKALSDQKKYQLAIDKYNEALDIKDDQGVLDQIKTLKGLLTDAENEQKYKDALASADMFYNQKSYKTAKDKYTIASKLKPNEQHPKTRLADIEKKLADLLGAQEKKKLFDDLVNEGDALFKEEKWAEAKTKYVESLKIETGATYSAEQVKDCDVKLKEISDAQEKIANIQKWLKEGDDFFKLNKWVDSKQKFTQVIGLDPENAIAKAKLIEISAKIEEETKNAALNAQISKLIADGDAVAKLQKLQEAKDKYSEAIKLKPDPLVQQKIDALDKQLKDIADKKAKEAEFLALKTEGLKLATEQKWEEAKVKLTAAKEIKADPAIDVKLTEIETKLKTLANQAKLETDYIALLSEAGLKEIANDVDGAIAKYKEALSKKPTGKEALDKIKELEAKKAALATAAQNEALFVKLVGEGDVAFDAKKNNDAKAKYEQALKLKNDPALVSKLETVNVALQAEKAKEVEFLALKTEGLKLATEQKWEDAKTKLTAAKALKADATIDTKLAEIETKLKALEGQAKLDSEYKTLLSEAEAKETANDVDGAIAKYKEALSKKPTGKEALDKIKELEAKKAALATATQNEALFAKLVGEGDVAFDAKKNNDAKAKYEQALKLKNDPALVSKLETVNVVLQAEKAKEVEFLALKTEGLKLATEQKWEDDKTKLIAAKTIKSDPAIDTKLAEIETKLKALEGQAKLDSEYKTLLSEAESKETANDVDGAIAKYKEALSKKPTGKEALDKIKELEAKKAALATAAQNEALFAKLVGEGDVAFDAKKNNDAKAKYEQALKLKNDPALVSKLETVNVALQAEKAKEVEFLALKTEGLKLATEQKWEDAKTKLIAAKTIKSDPAIDTKLAEIETKLKALEGQAKLDSEYKTLLSEAESKETANDVDGAIAKYKEALSKKPTGKEALDKIKELEAKKAALATATQNEALFAKIVGEGDVAFDAKKNNDAKAKYEQALKLKNDPALVSKLETVNVVLQAEKAKEVEFLALKTEGLKLATEQKWEDAKTKLTAAKALKADAAIDTKLAEIETKLKALEGQAKLDSEYKTLLSEAEAKETANDVDGAIAKYKEALSKKPTGKEALDKIKELEGKKNAASIAISEKYTALIKSGDALIQQKKYLEAIDEYKNALKIKENSKEAIDKIAEAQRLEQLNSSTQAKNLLEKTIVAAQGHVDKEEYKKAKEILTRPFINPEEDIRVKQLLLLIEDRIKQVEAYTQKMNEAEKKVIDQDYKTAISLFEEAKVIKSNEKMPQKRIDELKLSLNKESQVAEKNKMYLSFVAKGDEQKNVKNYKEAINSYNEALKLKNNEQTILDKIKEIQQILDNEVAAKQQAVIAQQAAKVQLEKADKLFQSQKFEAAKEAYLVVQQKDPSNDYVNKQIQLIEENIAILKQKNAQQEFTKLLKEANELFDSKSYIEAKSKFEKLLQIQTNNSVVKGKLKEIDEILNPPLAAGELKPLGEVFDGSILDGFAALQKAEEQRRYRSTSSIMDGVYAASKVKNEQAFIKDSEHYETSKTIEKLNQDKNQYNSELTSEIDARLSLLQKVETEQNLDNTEALVYISNDQIKLREKINLLQVESQELSLEQMISKEETLYSLKATINQEALKISESAKSDANENIDDDKTIQGFIVENDLYKTDQVSSKRKVDNTMRVLQNSTTDFLNVKDEQLKKETDERYQTLQSNQKEIDAEKTQGQTLKNEAAYDATQLVSKNREEQQKKQVIKEGRISDFYKEIKDQQNSLSDERNAKSQEKLDATAVVNGQIVDQFTKQKQDEAVKATKQAFNTEKLKELSNNELAAASDKNLKSNDKHIANQQTINQAEQAKTVKIISPNKLGETYEEGVTEESFVQKDEKGLMKAFITRRVVVIAGRGVVYVRTQTVHATTFTKDNVSITDSTWQKETQDPKLTKHKKN